jgi:hypothetical protein
MREMLEIEHGCESGGNNSAVVTSTRECSDEAVETNLVPTGH